MTYRIVPMTAAHLDRVEALERACFPEDPWSRRLFEEVLASDNAAALVGVAADGTLLGYLVFTVVLNEGNIDNLAVWRQARRQGIAAALMETLHHFARQWGTASLTLEVRPSNAGAVSLYKKLGYREVGRRRNYYLHPREDAVIMRLELTP